MKNFRKWLVAITFSEFNGVINIVSELKHWIFEKLLKQIGFLAKKYFDL